MIVKMFKGGGNAKSSADYLVGKKNDREGAREIKGDLRLTQAIAEQADFSQQITVGCLSFEEQNIPEKTKEELMERFENSFFAGLEKEDYSIAWIEHTDKDRLELNFYIANVELNTEKRLKPYFHKSDFHLKDSFQDVINYEYGFSSHKDPDKTQLISQDKSLNKTAKEIQNTVHEFLLNEVVEGNIKNRNDVIELLDNAYGISRVTPEAISFKNPNGGRNIRLKGEFYSERFYEQENTRRDFIESQESKAPTGVGTKGISESDYRESFIRHQESIRIRAERNTNDYKRAREQDQERYSGRIGSDKNHERGNDKSSESVKPGFDRDREAESGIDEKDHNETVSGLRNDIRSDFSDGYDFSRAYSSHGLSGERFIENDNREESDRTIIDEATKGLSDQRTRLEKLGRDGRGNTSSENGYGGIEDHSLHRERELDFYSTEREGHEDQRTEISLVNQYSVTEEIEVITHEIQREVVSFTKERNERIKENQRKSAEDRARVDRYKKALESVKSGIRKIGSTIQGIKQSILEVVGKSRNIGNGIEQRESGIKRRESEIEQRKSAIEQRKSEATRERAELPPSIDAYSRIFETIASLDKEKNNEMLETKPLEREIEPQKNIKKVELDDEWDLEM